MASEELVVGQVQEHIHRNDGLPEQIEQHDLKGPEEYEKE